MDTSGNSLGIQPGRLHSVTGVCSASHEAGIRLLWLSICRQQRLLRVLCVFYIIYLSGFFLLKWKYISKNNMFYIWCRFRMTNVRRWTRQEVRNGSNSPLTESGEPIRLGTLFKFKGTVHSKSNIQSSFTPNLYDFLSSAEHQRRYFEECW